MTASKWGLAIGGVLVAAVLAGLLIRLGPSTDKPGPEPNLEAARPEARPKVAPVAIKPPSPAAAERDPGVDPTPAPPPRPTRADIEDDEPFNPTPRGGPKNWTGAEGMRPSEITRLTADQGVSVEVFLVARKTTMIIAHSRNLDRVAELTGEELAPEARAELEKTAADLLISSGDSMKAHQRQELSEADFLDQLRATQASYQARYLELTGLTEEQFVEVFPYPLP